MKTTNHFLDPGHKPRVKEFEAFDGSILQDWHVLRFEQPSQVEVKLQIPTNLRQI